MADLGAAGDRGLRLFGHPAHAALSAFPGVLLSISVLGDAGSWLLGSPFSWRASFWTLAVGLVAAIPTACVGLVDYGAIPEGHAAAKTGSTHMVLMATAVACFAIALVVRGSPQAPHGMARVGVVALDASGAAFLLLGGWYGGELVFGHGIGSRAPPRSPATRAENGQDKPLGA